MTVSELRKSLKGVDGKLLVMTSGSDHSYDEICAANTENAGYFEDSNYYVEWWNEEAAGPEEKKIKIFVVT